MTTAICRNSWMVTVPLAAAAAAYGFLSFLPEREAIGEARRQVKQRQDYIVQAGNLAEALQAGQNELTEAQTYTTVWKQHAPVEGELSALYGQIHELAKTAGTTITRLDPEPAVHYERISRIPLAVGCIGSFSEICAFLEGLESLPLVVWENELHLRRDGQDGRAVACELSLAVFTCNSEDSDYVEHTE